MVVHSVNDLIHLAFSVVSMTFASEQKLENIQMKEGDDSSFKPRMPPPSKTSEEDKDTYKEKFKQMKLFIKFTGKNNGGIPDDKKADWDAANKDLREAIKTPTYNGPFFVMLDMLVSNLEPKSMIGIGFEGDNNDCTWTKALKIAVEYLTEKGFDVHVFAVKAMPSKLLINPDFFYGWRDVIPPLLFENKWHFLIVGDDKDPETKNFKETWTNNVAHIIVNLLSIRFHWNAAGDKFNAGARLMLEQVGLTPTADATMEKIYTNWDTEHRSTASSMRCTAFELLGLEKER